jgi:hypothetical protein
MLLQVSKLIFSSIDDYPKSQSFVSDKRFLAGKLVGNQNIISLNGSPWKKHRMVGTHKKWSKSTQLVMSFYQLHKIANPAFHRHMPVKLFSKLCEKMMNRFEIEDRGLSHVNVPALMQR